MSQKAEDIKAARLRSLLDSHVYTFIHFRGGDLMSGPGTHGFVPFDQRLFSRFVGKHYGGLTESAIADYGASIRIQADDWSEYGHLICFGQGYIWDMKRLEFVEGQDKYVFSSGITPQPVGSKGHKAAANFLMQLAGGSADLASDYLQAIAPLFMYKKPSGVIWFVGNGANGKSSLIGALYRILGKHFVSLTTSAIEDGKATLSLNGVLGNIVREGSEARVEDTERYKAIGTHEPFAVRKLYTQDQVTVDTNFHSIFNANNVPVFADKTQGVRRRTLIVPFPAHFRDDPTFEDRTFTDEFLGGLLTLILDETKVIAENGYRYKWSDATLGAKQKYDDDVNSAEAFVQSICSEGVLGFRNYAILEQNYRMWCDHNGYIALSRKTLKAEVANAATEIMRKSFRPDEGKPPVTRFFFKEAYDAGDNLNWSEETGYGYETEREEKKQVPLGKDW